jgi:hypothetical protein
MRQAMVANVLVALALPLLVCGPASGLVGADIADRTVQRYTVVVASTKGRCSGVVLSQNVVLTAAHCIQTASKLQVGGNTGGGYQTLPPAALSPVIETVQHRRGCFGRRPWRLRRTGLCLSRNAQPRRIDRRQLAKHTRAVALAPHYGWIKQTVEKLECVLGSRLLLHAGFLRRELIDR